MESEGGQEWALGHSNRRWGMGGITKGDCQGMVSEEGRNLGEDGVLVASETKYSFWKLWSSFSKVSWIDENLKLGILKRALANRKENNFLSWVIDCSSMGNGKVVKRESRIYVKDNFKQKYSFKKQVQNI